jgi:trimeric autotransporter adhesin
MRSSSCSRPLPTLERCNLMKILPIIMLVALLATVARAARPGNGETLPPITQQAYLKASNTRGLLPGRLFGDQFGSSVSVSGDTIVVGAPYEASNATGVNGNQTDTSADGAGAAYVFVRSGTAWTQQAYLKASNTRAGAGFGTAVAISGDIIIVGAPTESNSARAINGDGNAGTASQSGAAYVFVRHGTNWVQQAYLKASNADSHDRFGNSVAISGQTIVVGAVYEGSKAAGVNPNQNDNSAYGSGAAYVFVRSNNVWTQEAYLKASNPDYLDFFGWSVAISGNIVAVGAPWEFSNATGIDGDQNDNSLDNAGATYIFARHGESWVQEAYVKASNTDDGDAFGLSVAVSGETVVVGAFWEDSNAATIGGNERDNSAVWAGATYVFVRNGTNWSQQAYLKASNAEAGDWFGASVGIAGDTIVVGAPMEDSRATGVNGIANDNSLMNSGAAYVFTRKGTTWSQRAYIKPSNPGAAVPGPDLYGDAFGYAVSIGENTLIIGAFHEASNAMGVNANQSDDSSIQSGAAYIFTTALTVQELCPCSSPWKNHGEYLQCVVSSTGAMLKAGLLTEAERLQILQQASSSNCGKKNP